MKKIKFYRGPAYCTDTAVHLLSCSGDARQNQHGYSFSKSMEVSYKMFSEETPRYSG